MTIGWRFNEGTRYEAAGTHILDSRKVRCLNEDGSVAWQNSFHTRREAESFFNGDIRSMLKNDLYVMWCEL